eukprot:scaffold85626_cov16-Tisochrysis_lutea.AAC.1
MATKSAWKQRTSKQRHLKGAGCQVRGVSCSWACAGFQNCTGSEGCTGSEDCTYSSDRRHSWLNWLWAP